MPTPYVKKLAHKHGMSVDKAEDMWAEAKSKAKDQGHSEDWAYVTRIFKNMMGEKASMNLDQIILDYFRTNPNPSDPDIHELAGQCGVSPEELEKHIYRLFTQCLQPQFAHLAKIEARLQVVAADKPQWWIIKRDDQAGPYKTKQAAIKDGGTEKNTKYGLMNLRSGKFTKVAEPK